MDQPTPRYSALSIGLHWVMLALIAGVYACIELRGYFPRGSDMREGLKAWHFMLGLLILLLVVLRIVARLISPTPRITPEPPAWQKLLAKAVHLALYALMLVMPIAGWVILSAEGDPVPFFGLQLPPLVGPDGALAKQVEEVHETIGKLGYALIGLHAVAALFHHHVMRDDTLRRMMPGARA